MKIQQRAVNIESEYDYGARTGVWRLFRLFNKFNYKYTLYAVGKAIEDNPAVGISSVKNGHDVASHAYRVSVHVLIILVLFCFTSDDFLILTFHSGSITQTCPSNKKKHT